MGVGEARARPNLHHRLLGLPALDVVDEKPGLPKALAPIRRYFEYLVRKQYRYGYTVFFNINICRTNMDDVRRLTEIAHEYGIATDYHINESPMIEQPHFKHLNENSTYITQDDWPRARLRTIRVERPACA